MIIGESGLVLFILNGFSRLVAANVVVVVVVGSELVLDFGRKSASKSSKSEFESSFLSFVVVLAEKNELIEFCVAFLLAVATLG